MIQDNTEMEKLTISVVVCTKNRPQDLKECIDSIISQIYNPHQIVIVDSSDNDFTRSLAENYEHKNIIPIRYIHSSSGLTRQRNIGIRECHGSIIALLDDDVVLDKGYFKEILRCFMISDHIAGVGGRVVNQEQAHMLKRCFRQFFMLSSSHGRKGIMKKSGFANLPSGETMQSLQIAQVLSGCNCCYKRFIFDHYVFCEHFSGYGLMEDIEFSNRVSKHNILVLTPHAKLVHRFSPVERLSVQKLFEMRVVNHFYLFRSNVKQENLDWFFFWWSDFGLVLASLFSSLKMRTTLPLMGVYLGHRRLFKNMFKE